MKNIAILNGETVKEVENPNLNFRELIRKMGGDPTQGLSLSVLSEKGKPKPADLESRISDYFETRSLNMNGMPAKYNCLEIELKHKLDFWQYYKNKNCLIINRQIFDISSKKEKSIGTLALFSETFYITEKDPHVEIEIEGALLHDLMTRNYLNYRGSLYELDKGEGEIEIRGESYKITDRKRGAENHLATPDILSRQDILPRLDASNMKYEYTYREIREITIKRG